MNDVPEPTPPSSPAPAFNLDDLRLLPDWMKADAPAPPGSSARPQDRRYENYEDRSGDRDRRGDDFRRPPRPGGGAGGGFRGPRPGGGNAAGGGPREGRRDDRGPRPGGGGGGQRDRRDDRRGGGPPPRRFEERDRPAPTRPAPVRVEFLPDPRPLAGIAKEIRSRHLAYPLFGLARMFLERFESHRIRLTSEALPVKEGEKPGPPPPLFQLGEDGPISLSRATLENLAFDRYREQFYVEQSVQKDPPKGNFTSVARERSSGVLLGPPNHHSYQANLRGLYESRYSRRMGFEDFRRGVEIVSDPALVERWKEEFRTVTTYTVRATLPPAPPVVPPAAAPEAGSEGTGATENNETDPETPAPDAESTAAPASADVAPPVEAAPATDPAPVAEAVSAPADDAPAAPAADEEAAADAPKPVVFENLADVRTHFRENYLDGLLRSGTRLEMPGPVGRQLNEPSLTLSLRLAHEQELRYPAGLVQPLRVGLQNTGLHIFKHRKRVVYVSAIRPTPFRGGGETGGALSEGIAAILETVEAHPMVTGKELATRVVARRLGPDAPPPPAAGPVPAPAEAPVSETPVAEPVAPVAEPGSAGETLGDVAATTEAITPAASEPVPATTPDPRQEASDRFKAHLAADLRYLVGAGHIIAFHNNSFDLPLPPRPKEVPKPAAPAAKPGAPAAAVAAAVPSGGGGDAPVVENPPEAAAIPDYENDAETDGEAAVEQAAAADPTLPAAIVTGGDELPASDGDNDHDHNDALTPPAHAAEPDAAPSEPGV